jgi:hypothetical protein
LKNTSNRSSSRAKHGLRRIAVFSISKQDAWSTVHAPTGRDFW